MKNLQKIFSQIEIELENAISKFPTWPNDPIHALNIFQEEIGELSKDILENVEIIIRKVRGNKRCTIAS